ncbi:putative inactive ribonuclease-like protein 13 [Macrotis lagotis]|uniref:putative inactive ribonuclease-like protein 13 n=1 Tax=Macrotis lagotis TaxID=92651 RepID=UPI003D681C3C
MLLARILVLQLLLVPALTFLSFTSPAVRNFRLLHVDFPRVTFDKSFGGYCNGLISYVRIWKREWHCPSIHYVLHAPWKDIAKNCKYSDSFCEAFKGYCSASFEAIPLTVCSKTLGQPPTSCDYNGTLSIHRVYLLCSRKFNGEPISIIGLIMS